MEKTLPRWGATLATFWRMNRNWTAFRVWGRLPEQYVNSIAHRDYPLEDNWHIPQGNPLTLQSEVFQRDEDRCSLFPYQQHHPEQQAKGAEICIPEGPCSPSCPVVLHNQTPEYSTQRTKDMWLSPSSYHQKNHTEPGISDTLKKDTRYPKLQGPKEMKPGLSWLASGSWVFKQDNISTHVHTKKKNATRSEESSTEQMLKLLLTFS